MNVTGVKHGLFCHNTVIGRFKNRINGYLNSLKLMAIMKHFNILITVFLKTSTYKYSYYLQKVQDIYFSWFTEALISLYYIFITVMGDL